MQTRRNFIGNVATGLAGSFATGRVLGANSRIRVGVIGAGDRGTQLAREAMACPDTELVAFADVYMRRLEDAAKIAPAAKTSLDYRQMLDDAGVDAVLIATPQHLHAECFIAAMSAGKHVYQEKAMAFTVEQAQAMRAAYKGAGKQVVHARPEYKDFVDAQDGTPPQTAQLVVAAEHPVPGMTQFWLNWTKFDYLYVLFTEFIHDKRKDEFVVSLQGNV